jgi:hypothetical protein
MSETVKHVVDPTTATEATSGATMHRAAPPAETGSLLRSLSSRGTRSSRTGSAGTRSPSPALSGLKRSHSLGHLFRKLLQQRSGSKFDGDIFLRLNVGDHNFVLALRSTGFHGSGYSPECT